VPGNPFPPRLTGCHKCVAAAYYGTPFIDPGAQGESDVDLDTEPLPDDVAALTEQLAMTWLQAAAEAANDPSDRRQAHNELDILTGTVGESQGPREAVHRAYEQRLAADQTLTLMTLGSPLGLKSVVYERLQPQPPHVPAAVNRRENIVAKDDLVAAQLDLEPFFPPAAGSTVRPHTHIVDTGSKPHDITHYLTKPTAGRIVTETLTRP
jgi:hypothetical protein